MSNYQIHPDIVDLIKNRNPNGIKILYESYASILYGAIIRVVKDTKAAEHLLEVTFEKICKNITLYQQDQLTFLSWILQFARVVSIDYICIEQKNQGVEIDSHSGDLDLGKHEKIGSLMLSDGINGIENEVFDMVVEGCKVNEVAGKLNISTETVKINLRKAMKRNAGRN